MPIPLSYQISEYDCGPVSLINALNILFDRKTISPCIIKTIYQYTLDCVDTCGRMGRKGTSPQAIQFVADWLNHYARCCNFPIQCRSLTPEEIAFTPDSPLVKALESGCVAVIRCRLEVPHYVLATGVQDGWVQLWDPYHLEVTIHKNTIHQVDDHPYRYNRLVRFDQANGTGKGYYSLGAPALREATLFCNTQTGCIPFGD